LNRKRNTCRGEILEGEDSRNDQLERGRLGGKEGASSSKLRRKKGNWTARGVGGESIQKKGDKSSLNFKSGSLGKRDPGKNLPWRGTGRGMEAQTGPEKGESAEKGEETQDNRQSN